MFDPQNGNAPRIIFTLIIVSIFTSIASAGYWVRGNSGAKGLGAVTYIALNPGGAQINVKFENDDGIWQMHRNEFPNEEAYNRLLSVLLTSQSTGIKVWEVYEKVYQSSKFSGIQLKK